MGAAAEQGFPTLCSPPAPSAHGRHVISCSFFAPLIISALGSVHGGALPPVSRFSTSAQAPGSHFPHDLPAPGAGGAAQPSRGVSGATFPRRGSGQHRGRGGSRQCAGRAASYPVFILNQTFMFSPRGFQAQTVCTVRRPTARAEGAPAPRLRFFFFFFKESYGPVYAREFQTMEQDRALTEGEK